MLPAIALLLALVFNGLFVSAVFAGGCCTGTMACTHVADCAGAECGACQLQAIMPDVLVFRGSHNGLPPCWLPLQCEVSRVELPWRPPRQLA